MDHVYIFVHVSGVFVDDSSFQRKILLQTLITCEKNAFFPVTSSEKPSVNQIYYCSLSKILTVVSAIKALLKKSVLNQPKVACWSYPGLLAGFRDILSWLK